MTSTEVDAVRLRTLVAELDRLLTQPGQLAATDPDGFPSHVVAGELIESAWGNAVVDNLHQASRLLAYAEVTGNRGPFTGAADVTGLAITFTGVTARLYRATVVIPSCHQNVAAGIAQLFITDGAGALKNRAQAQGSINGYFTMIAQAVFPVVGANTVKVQLSTSAGNLTVDGSATERMILTVEDIGHT